MKKLTKRLLAVPIIGATLYFGAVGVNKIMKSETSIDFGTVEIGSGLYMTETIPKSVSTSYGIGLTGKVTYITHPRNGGKEVFISNGIVHDFFSEDMGFTDLDDDGLTDYVITNLPKKEGDFPKILNRKTDYSASKKEFDDADELLEELKQKYPYD